MRDPVRVIATVQVGITAVGVRAVVAGATVRSPEELREPVDEAEGAGVIPRAQEELPQDAARTMAGLVFDALGRRPAPGDGSRSAA